MTDLLYTAEPELRRPRAFIKQALADCRRAARPARALFVANLRARHRRAWLGYSWLAIPALAAAGLCAFAQARGVLAFRMTAMPYPIFAFIGMMLWQSFFDGLVAPLEQLNRSRQLITRSLISQEVVLGAALLQALLNACVRLVPMAIAIALYVPRAGAMAWLVPAGMLDLILLGFGLGLLAAPVGLLYDDVQRVLFTGAGFLFFLTPVVYPLPADSWLRFNPVAVLLATTRGWITGESARPGFAAFTTASLVVLVAGWLLYRLARPHLVARLG